jgi:hypothetical protein
MLCIEGIKNDMNLITTEIKHEFFTEEELALIMGTLLGDAHLNKRGESYRVKIAHGIDQKAYVLWKREKLARLCTTTQPPKEVTDNKGYKTVYFYTSSGKQYKEIFHLFYKKKGDKFVKTITPELIERLSMHPMVLAAFFMDDGSVRNDCYAGKLHTQCFSFEENQLLCSYLKKWGIEGNVVFHKESEDQYYIGLPAETFGTLVKIIEPIVNQIPDMIYKLNDQCKPRND